MTKKEAYGDINFYAGADYGLDSEYGKQFGTFGESAQMTPSEIALTTDPRTANQLQAVSQKISTGAKTIEVQGTMTKTLEATPKQHFQEIARLKKLAGIDLTFHGPIVEPSGWSDRGWSPESQQMAERQMFNALERSHDMEKDGNIVVTFHSTAGLPPLETKYKTKNGIEVTEVIAYDERDNKPERIPIQKDYLLKKGEKPTPEEEIKKINNEKWHAYLTQTVYHAEQGERSLKAIFKGEKEKLIKKLPSELKNKPFAELYKYSKTEEGQKALEKCDEEVKTLVNEIRDNVSYGEVYARQTYEEFQNHFNKAWAVAEKNPDKADLKKLKEYREKIQTQLKSIDTQNPEHLLKLSRVVRDGVNLLTTLEPPKTLVPMTDFIVDKSADTFSNLAIKSYDKFGSSSPIISIENPPAGIGKEAQALSTGEDLKKLVEKSREQFVEKAKEELGMSESEAKIQAEKLIGVTWDVGHINMMRGQGFEEKDIAKQAEKIAPLLKHIHLSDNFGYEHTELPMGMGNVPMKEHMKAIQKYGKQVDKIKKVVETADWYQHFKSTPLKETFQAFNSPVYAMDMAPTWNKVAGSSGGYFAGYGQMLPEQHFSTYGAGFSNLPVELGGQMSGKSRMSGTPME